VKNHLKIQLLSILLAAIGFAPLCASAQTGVGPVAITGLGTGWGEDAFGISTAEPIANPAGCATVSSYRAISTSSGYKTFLATALTAVSSGQKVTVIIHNTQCAEGWPMIIGININP